MKKRLNAPRRLAAVSLALALAAPGGYAFALEAPVPVVQPPAAGTSASGPVTAPAETLVPLRDFGEAIGAQVLWNATDRTAIVIRGSIRILAKIGDSAIDVNGKRVALDKPIQLVDEKTIAPLGPLNDAFGLKAGWDAQTNAVVVAKDDYALLASTFISAWNKGDLAKAKTYLNDSLRTLMPDSLLQQYWSGVLQTFGTLGPQLAVTESASAVHRNATALYQTEAAAFEMTVRFDTYGLIDDLYLSPTISNPNYQTPAYDDPTAYTEKEVTIGDGPLALPGTLTMPVGNGPFPVVVLVHGSGPNDRDESIGAVKTFRDLAVGLAAQGVAVLRYEKVTREHSLKLQLSGKPLTVKEETVDDAIRAVELLRHTVGIDPSRIYVAGHSQGGMLIPRIVEAGRDQGIAGAVVLAGPSRPLEDLIVEQLKFQLGLAKKAGVPTEAMERQVAQYEQQIQLLKDPQYSVDNPPPGFLLGDPTWWLDIRNWHAGEEAKDQKVPLLILQGENDIQVFPDNLDGWKHSLAARTDVEYKLYPKVNHTLVESADPSTGAEYAVPANVPDYIISDIAKWIAR